MSGTSLFKKLAESRKFKQLLKAIGGKDHIAVSGLKGASKALILSALYKTIGKPMIAIMPAEDDSTAMTLDLQFFSEFFNGNEKTNEQEDSSAKEEEFLCFPGTRCEPFELLSPHIDISKQRVHTLFQALNRDKFFIVASATAASRFILPKEIFSSSIIRLSLDTTLSIDELSEKLIRQGYKRVETVVNLGEFCIRGGIVDVFSPASPHPYRIDLFGDEIDSLRYFEPSNQRSMGETDTAVILPVRELIIDERGLSPLEKVLEKAQNVDDIDLAVLYQEATKEGAHFPGIENFTPLYYEKLNTLFDYLPDDAIVVLIDPDYTLEGIKRTLENLERSFNKTDFYAKIGLKPSDYYCAPEEFTHCFNGKKQISLYTLKMVKQNSNNNDISFDSSYLHPKKNPHIVSILNRVDALAPYLSNIFITCDNSRQVNRLEKEAKLEREELLQKKEGNKSLLQKKINFITGNLSSGFLFSLLDAGFIVEAELFGRSKEKKPKSKFRFRRFQSDFSDLAVNDFIVHTDHGIGQYKGLVKMKLDGDEQEFLNILYADGDRLYLPMDRLYLVQKYISAGNYKPKLDKLGATNWTRVKKKAKLAIRIMAEELLKLYASRELAEGIPFSPDSLWQREFEAGFEYEETEDQFEAIEEVKKDMESPKPMDRLVCGDVGYGKTEVAIRAAFKSVTDGKQVALLVPTTVLAQQHFQTFTERMKTYPINIEMLSRFRSKAEQKKILENLFKGRLDIIIGTHRLLQKDVKFNDLGLLIVDEEHRFGVRDKERIKELKKNIDVLTLTATPIPRTLHMALSQIRNLSIIDTPPENRLPIHTTVAKFDKKIIKEAIEFELKRGGQVYFIHNRVHTIDNVARLISRLVPDARIAIAHGQMKESHLEKVMLKFLSREFDVLVCSTIIESGIDIPSVNTIIINRADTFGLAQLYQLRGRVGRDKYQAHAYLLIPGQKLITQTARKRLEIIQEMTQLGSGFRIATHDLEIRGAGNILGAEQHGHMNAIGYDLYIQLLERCIEELKGNVTDGDFVSHIDLATGAKIPDYYISDDNQRLMMYKKISMSRNLKELTDIKQEFADRFGTPPEEVIELLRIAELRIRAKELKIKEVSHLENSIKFSFDNTTPIDPEQMVKLIHRFPKRIRFLSQNEILYDLPFKGKYDIVDHVKTVLNLLG